MSTQTLPVFNLSDLVAHDAAFSFRWHAREVFAILPDGSARGSLSEALSLVPKTDPCYGLLLGLASAFEAGVGSHAAASGAGKHDAAWAAFDPNL